MRVEYAEANCAGGRSFHPDCFCCSTCGVRLTANQLILDSAVHATVDEGSVDIFCTSCGVEASAERGFVFNPYRTLSGPAATFGFMVWQLTRLDSHAKKTPQYFALLNRVLIYFNTIILTE